MNKEKWIERSRELGLQGLEISQTNSASREIGWFDHGMDSFSTSKIISTSIRAMVDGKVVSISLEKVDDEDMDSVLNQLREQARLVAETEKDEFVPVMECEETLSLKTWKEPSVEQIKEVLASIEEKTEKADPRISQVNEVSWSNASNSSDFENSLGVHVQNASQYQLLSAAATMVENGEIRDSYVVEVVNDLDTFDQDAMVNKLIKKISDQLGATSISSRTVPVILEKEAMTTLFGCFASAFYGSLIAKGISPLCNKLGEQIFSDKITVVDDPRNQDALFLKNYDDEGVPTYTKIVVDKGVFETILHNTKSALKMDAQSTGNGFKSGAGATDVSAMNMFIVPGKDTFEELLQKMDNGVVITDLAGMHAGVDFITTNFSLQAKGFLVENGKIGKPLTLITIAGNFLDLMKNVEAVGDDLDWSYHSIACPSILFKEAAIGGND